jgi:parallel beta-helix repeat protein
MYLRFSGAVEMDRRLSSVIIITTLLSLSLGGIIYIEPGSANALPTRPSILIDGNINFTGANGITFGNGTESNPYIIENYNISASINNSIEIRNTDAHFIIRNMSLHSGKLTTNYGVFLYNVTNALIDNVTSYNNYYGIMISYSTKVTVTESRFISNRDGIYLSNSPYVNITNCDTFSNGNNGLIISSSDHSNIIENEIMYNQNYGIYIDSSDNNLILDNNVSTSTSLMYLLSSHYNKIFSNNIWQCDNYGIYLTSSQHNNISLNSITKTMYGIHPWFSSYTTIWNNNISHNSFAAVSLSHSSNTVVTNNECLSNGGFGIQTKGESNSNTIMHNELTDASFGIALEDPSVNNEITKNKLIGNYYGLHLKTDSDSNRIRFNTVTKNFIGIFAGASNLIDLISNTISDNENGIKLHGSTNTDLIDNTITSSNSSAIILKDTTSTVMTDNILTGSGLVMEGSTLSHWNTHSIDTTNTVDSKPILYWKDRTEGTVPAGIAQVILANCFNIIVDGLELSNSSSGIALGFSSGNTVVNNTVSDNDHFGIYLSNSDDNVVYGNDANKNLEAGIFVSSSQGNRIYNNALTNNANGVSLENSNSNIIKNNSISNNNVGVNIDQSLSNQIIKNSFIGNHNQTKNEYESKNNWNSEYPDCGNYWSDYGGEDDYSGPEQVYLGSDGIGDTPYLIDSSNLDLLPFMYPHDDVLPGTATNLLANTGDSFINIQWTAPVQAGNFPVIKYEVYRNTTTGSFVFYNEVWSVNSFNDTSVINGLSYTYKIIAVNLEGSGPFSEEVVAVPRTVPGAPQNLVAAADISEMILTWSPPLKKGGSVITGYRIYRGTESSNLTFLTGLGPIVGYTDIGGLKGTTYYYRVSSVNALGEGPRSAEVSDQTPDVPTPPRNLTAQKYEGVITLTWNAPGNNGGIPITGYRVHKSSGVLEEASVIQLKDVHRYIDSNVTEGNIYTYEVRAENALGEGALSEAVTVALPSVPGAPTNFTVTSGDAYILLNWKIPATDGSSAIRTYNIYRSTVANESFTIIKARKAIFYNDTDVINGVTYYYRVSAVNDVGEGPWTEFLNGTPSKPHNLAPTAELGSDRTSGTAPLTVAFTGSGSDADGKIVSYVWDFGDNNLTYTKDPVHTFEREGTYLVKFTVFDDSGGSTTVKLTITVQPADSGGADTSSKGEGSSGLFAAGIIVLAGIIVALILIVLWLKVFRFRNVAKPIKIPPEGKPEETDRPKEEDRITSKKSAPSEAEKGITKEESDKSAEPRKPSRPKRPTEPEDDPFEIKEASIFGFERE